MSHQQCMYIYIRLKLTLNHIELKKCLTQLIYHILIIQVMIHFLIFQIHHHRPTIVLFIMQYLLLVYVLFTNPYPFYYQVPILQQEQMVSTSTLSSSSASSFQVRPEKNRRFTSEQIRILEEHFYRVDKYVSKATIDELSTRTQLKPAQIRVWFNNKRTREPSLVFLFCFSFNLNKYNLLIIPFSRSTMKYI